MMTPIIEARSITKRFGGVLALDAVSLQVRQGELLSICGENGAGKSTLMKVICGQHAEFEGELLLKGQPVRFQDTRDAEQNGISIIHQELNLVEELSVAANIFLGREITRRGFLDHRVMRSKARAVLERLDCGLDPEAPVGQLRIGDQQLIEIAKAINLGSEMLVMDEPTSALTEAESARLDRVIAELRNSGVTILYISHKLPEILRLSDRVAVLRDGRNAGILDRSEATASSITRLMVGREFSLPERTVRQPDVGDRKRLQVTELSRKWTQRPDKWRLQKLSFSAVAGEVVGFAGLMGAGRTELFETLFGASEEEFSGEIRLDGEVVRFDHPAAALKAGVAMVTEDRKRLGLFMNLSVEGNIAVSSLAEDSVTAGLVSASATRRRCQQSVDSMQIRTSGLQSAIGSLSGGNQQKCVIGRNLLTRPRLMLLDDPTRGIDVGAKAEIYVMIRKLAAEGMCVLMSSSELPELLMICDRIIVLCEGRITADMPASDATEHRIMQAAVASP